MLLTEEEDEKLIKVFAPKYSTEELTQSLEGW